MTRSSQQFDAIEEMKHLMVQNRLWQQQRPPSSPPLAATLPIDPTLQTTPPSIRTLTRQSRYLEQRLAAEPLSSPSRDVLRSQLKGSVVLASAGAQAQDDLATTEAAQKACKRRERLSNKALQTGGQLYAYQARNMVRQLEQSESQKAAVLLKQERERQRRRWKVYKRICRQRLCVAVRGRGAVKANLRSTPWGCNLYQTSDNTPSRVLDANTGQWRITVDRSRQWQSYYPKDDPSCSRPRLVATKAVSQRKDDKTGDPLRATVQATPAWIIALEPAFQLAIKGHVELEHDGVKLIKQHLCYDFARNHLDDRELSDEEPQLFNAKATEEEQWQHTEPTDSQLPSQNNLESQDILSDDIQLNSDDIAAVFATQF